MALVRVYCGLASAQPSKAPAPADTPLTAAVVDDAGRLLDVCEISDEPSGYARLASLLAERSNGSTGVAIAADSDEHLVTALFNAAGRPLAFADEEAVDDYAERFSDDDSAEEIDAPQVARRAVGLARALQAGALSAVVMPTPRDLAGYKPVLSAHAALINGRQAAAVALREVLRELYPAALRAYPDPAEPVSLAVLDALPEAGLLEVASGGRARESAATEVIAVRLANEGVADVTTLTEAITALRVAASETPRRTGITKAITVAIAETVRQAVAAVRASDTACDTLVSTLTGRVSSVGASGSRRTSRRRLDAPAAPVAATAGLPGRETGAEQPSRMPAPPSRRNRQHPAGEPSGPLSPQPMAPPLVTPPPVVPRPVAPAASGLPHAPHSSPPGIRVPTPPPLRRQGPGQRLSPDSEPLVSPASAPPMPAAARFDEQLPTRPVSSPPPPPGITPIVPSQRSSVPPAEAGEPFRATLTAAAINSARAERQQRAVEARRQSEPAGVDAPPPPGINAADVSIPVPATRPTPAEPGSRANWPLLPPSDDRAGVSSLGFAQYGDGVPADRDRASDLGKEPGRVTPPWQANDLPPEPPMLRLVEPPTAERRSRTGLGLDGPGVDPLGPSPLDSTESALRHDHPPLRLVEPEAQRAGGRLAPEDLPPAPPVSSEGDGDLLIFAAARSAWFTGQDEETDQVEWSSSADDGWRAAEQAAVPSVGAETNAGLPKRVPKANLVPGSPIREERPLRIVRDPASIAAHTTGYFRGWRRGQEIGGYAVGGRPGRESAGGWDFSRDPEGPEEGREYEYRSASYRS